MSQEEKNEARTTLKHFHRHSFFNSLPAVLTAAQFSNSDGLSKQFLESADCLSIYSAPRGGLGSLPGERWLFMKMYAELLLC